MSNDTASSAGMNRVPKGIPTGGQFAATAHAEPTLSLATERLSELVDVEDFVDIAYTSAAHWQRRYNQADKSVIVDRDDIAQETILRTLEALDKGRKITDFKQMVTSTAANVTVRATETVFRAEDRKAYRIFEAQREATEAKSGRPMTQREKDDLAQTVLDEWHDPRHKPSKDFRIARTFDRSLDAPHGADGGVESTLGATLVNPEQSGHYIEPGSYMDRAHSAMEETGAAHKAEMKRLPGTPSPRAPRCRCPTRAACPSARSPSTAGSSTTSRAASWAPAVTGPPTAKPPRPPMRCSHRSANWNSRTRRASSPCSKASKTAVKASHRPCGSPPWPSPTTSTARPPRRHEVPTNRVPKGVRGGGQFAASAHMEPDLSITNAEFPSVGDADVDQLRALSESSDPLVRAEVTSSIRVPDDVLERLAEADQPPAVRLAAVNTGYAGTADRAANDPQPLVRAAATAGWDLSEANRERLSHDPEVQQIIRTISR